MKYIMYLVLSLCFFGCYSRDSINAQHQDKGLDNIKSKPRKVIILTDNVSLLDTNGKILHNQNGSNSIIFINGLEIILSNPKDKTNNTAKTDKEQNCFQIKYLFNENDYIILGHWAENP